MNAVVSAARRFALRGSLVIGALLLALAALVSSSFSVAAAGHTGQAVALRAALNPAAAYAALQSAGLLANLAAPGRRPYNPNLTRLSGAVRQHGGQRKADAAAGPILINEGVQTFDVFAPPPSFQSNLPAGPLTPTNLTPVWSADETFLLFSSNRDASGAGVAADNHFHIWSVPAGGGAPTQITSGPGNEYFPALNATNSALAFVSDANSTGNLQLYVIGGQTGVSFSGATPVDVSTLTSPNTNKTVGATLFSGVTHPTWSPGGDRIVFAATTTNVPANTAVAGRVVGVSHLYTLFVATNGYQQSPPPGTDNPPAQLTDGPAADTDPAWSPDGNYICFASTASNVATTGQQISPTTSPARTDTSNVRRSLFLLAGGSTTAFGSVPTGLPGGRVTLAGTDNYGPAWSANQRNNYFNPNGTLEYIAFARAATAAAPHDIYYFRLADLDGNSTLPISAETGAGTANAALRLNTDDNAGQTSVAGNAYNDAYPTWSPFSSVFSIAYQSNRSITYNDPISGLPLETAVSLAEGTNSVGTGYAGLLVSQVINLDPPALLRYSGNEVVHVQNAQGVTTRNLQPSTPATPSPVTFTVRVSNREAGTDPSRVFLQIKDPDSRYQDTQGLEHKCFVSTIFAPNPTQAQPRQGPVLNSVEFLFNGGKLGFNKIGTAVYDQYGVVGGADGGDTLAVGHLPAVAQEMLPVSTQGSGTPAPTYQAFGPEWECQYLNPTVANPTTNAGDYGTPYYLAGYDDQRAFSGNNAYGVDAQGNPTPPVDTQGNILPVGTPRPAYNPTTGARPADPSTTEWIQLTKLAAQDGKGGVLYGATYNLPTAASDFYLDVIAYDRAVFPAIAPFPATPAVTGNDYHGQSVNWRIYDNVGGFTSAQFTGANDILVVSDNALGQKFSATSFGQNGNTNLLPTFFGAESYYTDIDLRYVPNAIDHTSQGAMGLQHSAQLFTIPNGFTFIYTGAIFAPNSDYPDSLNALGVNSYNDSVTDDGGRINAADANLPSGLTTASFVRSQKYSLWRTLSRGPLPSSVLASYQPSFQSQPAVADPVNGVTEAVNAKVPVATRCVIWVSPYTGDLPLEDVGALSNPTTQDTLRSFVNAGGRLCITGQDVAAALSLKGRTANTFLSDILQAQFKSAAGGTQTLSGSNSRITGDAGFQNSVNFFPVLQGDGTIVTTKPSSGPLLLGNDLGAPGPPNWRADGSLDQLGPGVISFNNPSAGTGAISAVAQIDTVTPLGNSVTDTTTGGSAGLIYHENYTSALGAGYGSRVVFGSFGLEGLSQEYDKVSIRGTDYYTPRNTRSNVLHNIVCYFRTGTFTGRVTQANGVGVAGATVYARGGVGIPGPRQTFSALTGSDGAYTISGLEPGIYTVAAYKTGFNTTSSNGSFAIEGDTTHTNIGLVIAPVPAGRIAGTVKDKATGGGIGGATVSFASVDGQITLSTVTLPDGSYTIDNVPAGSYNGSAVLSPAYAAVTAPTQGNPVIVPSGGTAPADFLLVAAPAKITVTVTDGTTGRAVPGASLTLVPDPNKASPQTTNASGVAVFANLPAVITGTTYTVKATLTGYAPNQASVSVTPGQAAGILLVLTPVPAPATIIVHVVDSGNGASLPGASVKIAPDPNGAGVQTTNASGSTTFANLPTSASGITYTLTATLPGYTGTPVTQTVTPGQTVTVTIALVPPIKGTLGGLVQDGGLKVPLTGATVSVYVTGATTPLQTVTTGTASSPAAPTGDGSALNFAFTLVPGTYDVSVSKTGFSTVKRTKFVVTSAHFTRADFTGGNALQPIHVFQAGLNFFSLPYDYSGTSFDTLLGAYPDARSHVLAYQPQLLQYVAEPTPPADAPHLGQGYWVRLKQAAEVTVVGKAPAGATVSVALREGWNMIGVPSTSAISVSSLTFPLQAGSTPLSFADATSAAYRLVYGTLYTYPGTSASTYAQIGANGSLQPWQAYWIYAYVDTTVLIPTSPVPGT